MTFEFKPPEGPKAGELLALLGNDDRFPGLRGRLELYQRHDPDTQLQYFNFPVVELAVILKEWSERR